MLLKRQIEASATEKGGQAEVEERAKLAEEKFKKLREVYQKLRTEHITLLRTNGDTQQQINTATKTIAEEEDKRKVCGFVLLVVMVINTAGLMVVMVIQSLQDLEQKSNSLMMEVEELKVHAVS